MLGSMKKIAEVQLSTLRFLVLMDFDGKLSQISKGNMLALNIISYVGCVISIVCLLFCLIIFTFFRYARK